MDALANLGIDGWGLVLYAVNFGVLMALMHHFVYKPLVRMMDERRNVIKKNVQEAQDLRADLAQKAEAEQAERKQREQALDERILEAKSMARKEAKTVIDEANQQREAILSQAAKAADETKQAAIAQTEKEILDRVRRVVSHVLESDIPEDVVNASVERSWKALSK